MAQRYSPEESDLLTEYVVTDPTLIELVLSLLVCLRVSLRTTVQELVKLASGSEE